MEKRLALVVGNSNYDTSPLQNPSNDAHDISAKLKSFGFTVKTLIDCKLEELEDAIEEFEEKLDDYDVGMFFFAGHGIQIDNSNYLIMIDTLSASKRKAIRSSIPLDNVLQAMDNSSASTKIVILDACRSNPWKRSWARSVGDEGLASVYAPKGTIIGYATSPGEVADDGAGRNGLYTSALLNQIGALDRPIEAVFKRVRGEVAAASRGEQTTWEHTSLSGDFFFNTSVSQAIGDYHPEALADDLFEPEPGSFAEKTIRALKTYNWYKQNPAVMSLSLETLGQLNPDELFVIGRNILQAAHGSSGSAEAFVDDIRERVEPWPDTKAKAILDGILFEMFFDRNGQPRDNPKGAYHYDGIARLRKVPRIKKSLDFITKCLQEAKISMLVYPNQESIVAVTITHEPKADKVVLTGVWVDSRNLIKPSQEDEDVFGIRKNRLVSSEKDDFETMLSETLIVPIKQLEISYQPEISDEQIIHPLSIEFDCG